jgi:hypothetical protein
VSSVVAASAVLAFQPSAFGPRQLTVEYQGRGVPKCHLLLHREVPELVPKVGELVSEFVPIGERSVSFADEFGIARLDPREPSVVALECSVGGGEVLAKLTHRLT